MTYYGNKRNATFHLNFSKELICKLSLMKRMDPQEAQIEEIVSRLNRKYRWNKMLLRAAETKDRISEFLPVKLSGLYGKIFNDLMAANAEADQLYRRILHRRKVKDAVRFEHEGLEFEVIAA